MRGFSDLGAGRRLDVLLDLERALGEIAVLGLHQESVEPAAMVDRAQRRGGDAELEGLAQRVALQGHAIGVEVKPLLSDPILGECRRGSDSQDKAQEKRGAPDLYWKGSKRLC